MSPSRDPTGTTFAPAAWPVVLGVLGDGAPVVAGAEEVVVTWSVVADSCGTASPWQADTQTPSTTTRGTHRVTRQVPDDLGTIGCSTPSGVFKMVRAHPWSSQLNTTGVA